MYIAPEKSLQGIELITPQFMFIHDRYQKNNYYMKPDALKYKTWEGLSSEDRISYEQQAIRQKKIIKKNFVQQLEKWFDLSEVPAVKWSAKFLFIWQFIKNDIENQDPIQKLKKNWEVQLFDQAMEAWKNLSTKERKELHRKAEQVRGKEAVDIRNYKNFHPSDSPALTGRPNGLSLISSSTGHLPHLTPRSILGLPTDSPQLEEKNLKFELIALDEQTKSVMIMKKKTKNPKEKTKNKKDKTKKQKIEIKNKKEKIKNKKEKIKNKKIKKQKIEIKKKKTGNSQEENKLKIQVKKTKTKILTQKNKKEKKLHKHIRRKALTERSKKRKNLIVRRTKLSKIPPPVFQKKIVLSKMSKPEKIKTKTDRIRTNNQGHRLKQKNKHQHIWKKSGVKKTVTLFTPKGQ